MAYWGNLFVTPSKTTNPRLNGSNDTCSYRFTAQDSKTVAQVHVYVNFIAGTSPTYRIGLQGDNSGDPDGSWLGTNAYVDQQLAVGGNACNITDAAITASTVYHLVIEYQSGTINGSNYAQMKNSDAGPVTTRNLFYPFDGTADVNLGVRWSTNGGSSWSDPDTSWNPTFYIEHDDATYFGQPIDDRIEFNLNGVNARIGEMFTVPENKSFTDVDTVIKIGAGTPGALLVYLYNHTDSTYLVNGETVTTAGVTGSYAWLNHTFGSTQSLVTGKTYKLWYHSSASDSGNYWRVLANISSGDATWDGLTFQGTTGVVVTGSSPPATTDSSRDYIFRFTEAAAPSGGAIQLIVDGGVHQLIVDGGVIQKIVT